MATTTAQVTRRGLLTLSMVAAGSLLVKPVATHQTCSNDSLRQWFAKPIGFCPLKPPLG